MLSEFHSTWLEIDRGAIRTNIKQIEKLTSRPVMPIIKANAYGHGLTEVARTAESAGVPWLGVARTTEALTVRKAGITTDILVLGPTPNRLIEDALADNICVNVYNQELAEAYSAQAVAVGKRLRVHAKFDSGMGRLGVFPEEGVEFVRWLKEQPGLELEGIFTHFAKADEADLGNSYWQLQRFQNLIDGVEAAGLRPRWVHACNSAAALKIPEARFDMVRAGIAIYGLDPSDDAPLGEGFVPALSWKTRLTSIKTLPAGHGVGYNYRYTTNKTERIGVIGVGYADGFRRRVGNYVLVNGKRTPVVGGVCMDQCMVQLDDLPEARVGDEVVLIGKQNDTELSAEEVAACWGTVNYDVVCGLAARVMRIYF